MPEFSQLVNSSISAYRTTTEINDKELTYLPLIMRAHYAAYLLKTSYLIFAKNDRTQETKNWFDFSRRGLRQLQQYQFDLK